MIIYSISAQNPQRHFIDIEVVNPHINDAEKILVQMPSWRPGRYELANYAQNIQQWLVEDENGLALPNKKISKDCWEVETNGAKAVHIKYNYFAYQLDAGASYFDENQLYVNPVNCMVYFPEQIELPCQLKLVGLPHDYHIASGMHFNLHMEAELKDFHELADMPFIASNSLQHQVYSVGEYVFHIWIQGIAKPDWNKVLMDFYNFSRVQIEMFRELPVKEYHFLYQMPDHKFYHGVEHLNNTVIALGPGYKLMSPEMYADFLGISSHELFHSWNIKSIRPVELQPYDYSRENYSNLGYVAEGVTTYYGDLKLLRGGVYSWEEYAIELQSFMHRHFHVFGRYFQTLAQSSWDTWLDGYKPGIPDRKVNMYVKGMMVAFILDMHMRYDTENQSSLDDIMRILYHDFAKQGKGYSEEDYLQLVSKISGHDYRRFFDEYVWGLMPLEESLEEAYNYIGCTIQLTPNPVYGERKLGIKQKSEASPKTVIAQIAPDSAADKAGLSINDEILAVNEIYVENNLNELLQFHEAEVISLHILRGKKILEIDLKVSTEEYFQIWNIRKVENATDNQKENFKKWAWVEF
ncbi:MAG: M61 family metallopeptidase [Bacteroidia bacterium]